MCAEVSCWCWEDKWLGNTTLRGQYPALYHIARNQSGTIAKLLSTSPPNLSFRCDLVGPRLASCHVLLGRLALLQLSQGQDVFSWNLHQNVSFSVDSMYRALTRVFFLERIFRKPVGYRRYRYLPKYVLTGRFFLKILKLNSGTRSY